MPVSLVDIMKSTGNRPPGLVKSELTIQAPTNPPKLYIDIYLTGVDKATWLLRERLLWSKLFKIPIHENMPPGFPQNMENVSSRACEKRTGCNSLKFLDPASPLCGESSISAAPRSSIWRTIPYIICVATASPYTRRTQVGPCSCSGGE